MWRFWFVFKAFFPKLGCSLLYCLKNSDKNNLPLLWPFCSLSTVHSSMVPKGAYIIRTSFSVHFLDSIPINNFRSSENKQIQRIFKTHFQPNKPEFAIYWISQSVILVANANLGDLGFLLLFSFVSSWDWHLRFCFGFQILQFIHIVSLRSPTLNCFVIVLHLLKSIRGTKPGKSVDADGVSIRE